MIDIKRTLKETTTKTKDLIIRSIKINQKMNKIRDKDKEGEEIIILMDLEEEAGVDIKIIITKTRKCINLRLGSIC